MAEALRRRWPDAELYGLGGDRMAAAGVDLLAHVDQLAVMGFVEVLRHLPYFVDLMKRVKQTMLERPPDLVIPIDYPGFNLRLARHAKETNHRVLYYIAPQVWAWHPERAGEMARWVDALAVVFRFEVPIFEKAGVPTRFVGHPLVDELEAETDAATLRSRLGVDAGAPLLGLLPGSRRQELARHLAPMIETARRVRRTQPDVVPVLALAPGLDAEVPADSGIRIVRGLTHAVQAHAAACVVASGTATLETALFGTPLAIVYRVGTLNYAIARRLVTIGRIGLPNIVTGEDVAPEFVQADFVPERVAAAVRPWLADPAAREAQAAKVRLVRAQLGDGGASARAAAALEALVP